MRALPPRGAFMRLGRFRLGTESRSKVEKQKSLPRTRKTSLRLERRVLETLPGKRARRCPAYLGGAGVNPSRLRPGSGLGLGFGAFLTSFLPLSLLPMPRSVTQKGLWGKDQKSWAGHFPV